MANNLTTYTPELAEEILALIVNGNSVRKIAEMKGMPARRTIVGWIAQDREGFRRRYAEAVTARAFEMGAELIELADGAEELARTGGTEASALVQARRLAVGSRQWILSKLVPAFGDRIRQELTGAEGAPLLAGEPSPTDEAIEAFCEGVLNGFEAYEDDKGGRATYTREVVMMLMHAVGCYGANRGVSVDDPEKTGNMFAMIERARRSVREQTKGKGLAPLSRAGEACEKESGTERE